MILKTRPLRGANLRGAQLENVALVYFGCFGLVSKILAGNEWDSRFQITPGGGGPNPVSLLHLSKWRVSQKGDNTRRGPLGDRSLRHLE